MITATSALLLVFVSLPVEAAPRAVLEGSGFVARAQRATLVVVGRVEGWSRGILGGCGVRLRVEKVLRGTLEGDTIDLNSTPVGDDCPPLHGHDRWVVALDAPDIDPREVAKEIADWPASAKLRPGYPPGLSWRLPIEGAGYVKGEILRCHGVTIKEAGALATNEPERMALLLLEGYLRKSPRPLCDVPRASPSRARRTIEGQVVYASGEPRRAELELVPVGQRQPALEASTDDQGRFRISGVPDVPVWLRSPENNFEPFLLPAGVRRVRAVSRAAKTPMPSSTAN